MITRKDYKKIGNYSVERQALDEILKNFNHDVYSKMYDILESGQIDDFDDISQKENFINLVKMNIDMGNYVLAVCFLALLHNFNNITDQEKFDILENSFDKLKIGESATDFLKLFNKITHK